MALRWKGTLVAIVAAAAVGVFLAPVVRPANCPERGPAMQAGLPLYSKGTKRKPTWAKW
jgi:hypothetical protein